jgi:flagellar assembly factor FliW
LNIETTRFGTISIEEERIIFMPHGMLGFPERHRFVLLQHKEQSPLYWYQSVADPVLVFVLTNHFLFVPDYRVDVDDYLNKMSWGDGSRGDYLEFYVVVNVPKGNPEKMTANLIGPLLVNNSNLEAMQVVVNDSEYTHNHPLL